MTLHPREIPAHNDHRIYVQKVLNLYLGLPDTPSRTSRNDRQLALRLFQQSVPLETVEAAFLLAAARRTFRDPSYPPLGPIRSLHYFLPVIHEILANHPPMDYLRYLRLKLASHAAQKHKP